MCGPSQKFVKHYFGRIVQWLTLICCLTTTQAAPLNIVIIPKLTGIAYYDAVKRGVDEASAELPQVHVEWIGPTQDRVEKQIELIEKLIPQRPDLIAIAANDPVAIVPVLKKAKAAGIHIMSWDGDTQFREFFVNLVDFSEFGTQIVDALAKQIGNRGDIAIITTSFTAPNQSHWLIAIKKRLYDHYPDIQLLDIRAAGENTEEANRITRDYLATFPTLKGIIALGAPNLPGVASAVALAGKSRSIAVTGNSTPGMIRAFMKRNEIQKAFLWNAVDHGYLTVYSAYALLQSGLSAGRSYTAGRLGTLTPEKDAINARISLPVLIFTRDNIDAFNF